MHIALFIVGLVVAEDIVEKIHHGDGFRREIDSWVTLSIATVDGNIIINAMLQNGRVVVISQDPATRFAIDPTSYSLSGGIDSDEGDYMIHVTTATQAIDYHLAIVILKAPTIFIEPSYREALIESDENTAVAKCMAIGAKPAGAIVTWAKHGVVLPDGTEESTLELVPNRQYNQAIFTCTVRHEALTSPLTESFTINVEYPPGTPSIQPYNPDCNAEVTNILQLKCADNEKFAANPSVGSYEWTVPGENEKKSGEIRNVDLSMYSPEQYSTIYFDCQTRNKHGQSPVAHQSLADLHVMGCPTNSSFGVGIGIVVTLIVVVLAVVFVFYWRKLLCFADDEEDGDYIDEELNYNPGTRSKDEETAEVVPDYTPGADVGV